MPYVHTSAPVTLEDFLSLSEADQLAHVEACADRRADLLSLHDGYVRWAEAHAADPGERRWLSLRVLGRLLDILLPGDVDHDGYREAAQDGRLRERLTGAALTRVREESYRGTLAPLLTADEPARTRFMLSLDPQELRTLDILLARFGSERGHALHGRQRGHAAVLRAVQSCVTARLEAVNRREAKGKA